jgi:4-hydroxy-tetrahydrodipicolinate synthase
MTIRLPSPTAVPPRSAIRSTEGDSTMFTGLSAFPLTPLADDAVDESAFVGLIRRLAAAQMDSITALGSTGSYAYLSTEERRRVAHLAVEHAGDVPVFVGIGALRTSHVLTHLEHAQQAGAAAVLLAPMSYQPLTDDDVVGLFDTVTAHSSVPVIVYDNPGTTHVTFSTELYGRIGQLTGIASLKIPGVPADPQQARARVREIRAVVPQHVSIGISGDATAAAGLTAGCDAALAGRAEEAVAASDRLAPLWELFGEFGSLRVVAAVAEQLDLVPRACLPLPLQGLDEGQRDRVARVVDDLGLDDQP